VTTAKKDKLPCSRIFLGNQQHKFKELLFLSLEQLRVVTPDKESGLKMYSWFQQQFGFCPFINKLSNCHFPALLLSNNFLQYPIGTKKWGLNTLGSGRKIEDLAAVLEIGKGTIL
jgi:hypothetical protein